MPELHNQTPFAVAHFFLPDARGVDTLYVVIKGTFDTHPEVKLAEAQWPVCLEDQYWGDPANTSVKFASEVHLGKPGTDVVVVGEAIAPQGRPVQQLEVALSVAGRARRYLVSGDRCWKGWCFKRPGKALPFTRLPLQYERAFGGSAGLTKKGMPDFHPMNPVGKGYRGFQSMKAYRSSPLPNVEDLACRLKKPGQAKNARPAGLGFMASTWQPRLAYAGTLDAAWLQSRAPFLPEDFNPRFFHMAHPDWVFDQPLKGGEEIRTLHLSERITQQYALPHCRLSLQARVAGESRVLEPRLETVLLLPGEEKLALTWRACLPCDKALLKVEAVTVAWEAQP